MCTTSGRCEGRCEEGVVSEPDLSETKEGGGQCPTKNLEFLLVKSCPRTWDCNNGNTACSVDSRLINAKFVNYNNRALPPLTSTWRHACVSISQASLVPRPSGDKTTPRPSPSIFAYCKWSKTGGRNGLATSILPGSMIVHANIIASYTALPSWAILEGSSDILCNRRPKIMHSFARF